MPCLAARSSTFGDIERDRTFFERRFPETQLANGFEKSLKLGTVISLDLIDHAGTAAASPAPEHALDDAIVRGHAVRRVLRPA